jgi:hypothetical protein
MSNEVAARIWAEIGGRPLIVLVPDLDDRSLSVATQQRLAFPALKNVEDEDDERASTIWRLAATLPRCRFPGRR